MNQFAPAWRENAQFLLNGTVSFDAPLRTRVTFGCNNLLDKDPPFASSFANNSNGYPGFIYNATGRFVYVSLEKMDHRLLEAAADLYSTPARAFRKVTLPLSLPGLMAGLLLCFVLAAGSYVTPQILGSTRDALFGNIIFDTIMGELNWPMGSTLSLVLLIFLGAVAAVEMHLLKQEHGALFVHDGFHGLDHGNKIRNQSLETSMESG